MALKARYRTASHELIARRMLECSPPVMISIFDHRRSPFGGATFPAVCRRHRRPRWDVGAMFTVATIRCGLAPARGFVQGWPIHEEGWKREILRMEIDEYAAEWCE